MITFVLIFTLTAISRLSKSELPLTLQNTKRLLIALHEAG